MNTQPCPTCWHPHQQGAVAAAHLTGKAVAQLLDVSPEAVYAMVRDGRIERDDVSGGIPLHEVAVALRAREQHLTRPTVTRGREPRSADDEVVAVRKPVWAAIASSAVVRGMSTDELLYRLLVDAGVIRPSARTRSSA